MAMLFLDSMEMMDDATYWPTRKRYNVNVNYANSLLVDATGSNFSNGTMWMDYTAGIPAQASAKLLQASHSSGEVFIGFWFKISATIAGFTGLITLAEFPKDTQDYNDASSLSCSITVDSSGYMGVQAWYSTDTAVDWTGSTAVDDNAWHFFEARLHWDNSTGDIETYIDGSADITQNLIDTIQDASPPTFNGFEYIGLISDGGAGKNIYFDDVVIYDVDGTPTGTPTSGSFPLGEFKIEVLRPDSAGSSADFTALQGLSNYDEVNGNMTNDVINSVYSQTSTDWDSYNFGSLSNTPDEIHTVVVEALARRIGTGSAYIQLTAENNGTVTTDSSQSLSKAARVWKQFEVPYDPDTASGWTASGINAAEFGFKFSTS
jgi:hypothetical protein